MRKFMAALLVLWCLAAGFALAQSEAAEPVAQGECGDNTTWAFYTDGTLVISGEGAIWDCLNADTNEVGWRQDYKHDIKKVVFGEGVTRVGSWALSECSSLSEIEFSSTMRELGWGTFWRCTALTQVTLPEGLLSIEGATFDETGLRSVVIPPKVTELAGFQYCAELESVLIRALEGPWAAYEVGSGLFCGCPKLKEIQVEAGHPALHVTEGVLYSGTTLVSYPAGKEDTVFRPEEGTVEIAQNAFRGAFLLEEITFPDSVETIGDAFGYCENLTYVELPKGMTSLSSSAFEHCYALQEVMFQSSVPILHGFTFWDCPALEEIVLPEGLETIGNHVFYADVSLQSVVIPSTVTAIEAGAFRNTAVEVVHIPSSVEEIQENVFTDTPLAVVICEEGSYAADWAQENGVDCVFISAEREVLPADVKAINARAFAGTALTHVVVPQGCERIDSEAFAGCMLLRIVELPESVSSIAEDAFSGCGDVVIRAARGSFAAQWAAEQGIPVWFR